ncbi:MAG TPA: co-chaperone GroES [Actinocrinis sp.]|nr:co-chaperone GroES [Actinocrinis sp.]
MSPRSKSDDEKPVVPAEGVASLRNAAPLSSTASLDKLPIKMLHDRVLVRSDGAEGERRSSGGILIPATAQMSHRLAWAQVVAIGQNVRTVEIGDRVLYDPDDRAEVEVRGVEYVLLRERDIHAVAAERLGDSSGATGLYL